VPTFIPINYDFKSNAPPPLQRYEPDAPRPEDTQLWFDSQETWEYPHQSRIISDPIALPNQPDNANLRQWYYDTRINEFHQNLERG